MGIDIGSTATKVVVLQDGYELIQQAIVPFGAGTSGADQALKKLSDLLANDNISLDQITYTVATGYGRQLFSGADKQISELSCHAKAIHHIYPNVHTVIDIGGQDVKVLHLSKNGQLDNFIMNEKCAAGTGRFLDVMAGVLETTTDNLASLDRLSSSPVEISSTCTVFAESEVISYLSYKQPIENIVAGIHNSVAKRTAGLTRRLGIVEDVAMSGGVAKNGGVVRALEQELSTHINVSQNSQLMGAIGAAIYAYEKSK